MFADDGALFLADRNLKRWNGVPTSATRPPDVVFEAMAGHFDGGDGIDMVQVGERMYLLDPNGNKILGFNQVPSRSGTKPDFAVGAPRSNADTLADHFLQTNPEPATDGRGLFSISSYDKTLYVWKQRPDQSAAAPDFIYHFGEQPQDIAVSGDRVVVAGLMHNIFVWDSLPFAGEGPSRAIHGRLGSVRLQGIQSIAMDDRYFYLLSRDGLLSVWEGVPEDGQEPLVQVRAEKGKLATDGQTLLLAGKGLWTASVDSLVRGEPLRRVRLGGVQIQDNTSLVADLGDDSLFVTDRNQNQIWVWNDLTRALGGSSPDAVLGAENRRDTGPEIGRDSVFWPNRVAYDGDYLWVGEFKFSGRMLRFSPDG
jgi:hypothetical protein